MSVLNAGCNTKLICYALNLFTVAALIFFILEGILLARITIAGYSSLNRTSVNIKIASTVILWFSNIIKSILQYVYLAHYRVLECSLAVPHSIACD